MAESNSGGTDKEQVEEERRRLTELFQKGSRQGLIQQLRQARLNIAGTDRELVDRLVRYDLRRTCGNQAAGWDWKFDNDASRGRVAPDLNDSLMFQPLEDQSMNQSLIDTSPVGSSGTMVPVAQSLPSPLTSTITSVTANLSNSQSLIPTTQVSSLHTSHPITTPHPVFSNYGLGLATSDITRQSWTPFGSSTLNPNVNLEAERRTRQSEIISHMEDGRNTYETRQQIQSEHTSQIASDAQGGAISRITRNDAQSMQRLTHQQLKPPTSRFEGLTLEPQINTSNNPPTILPNHTQQLTLPHIPPSTQPPLQNPPIPQIQNQNTPEIPREYHSNPPNPSSRLPQNPSEIPAGYPQNTSTIPTGYPQNTSTIPPGYPPYPYPYPYPFAYPYGIPPPPPGYPNPYGMQYPHNPNMNIPSPGNFNQSMPSFFHPSVLDMTGKRENKIITLLEKWKITYRGTEKEDVEEFLQNLEDFQDYNNVTEQEILKAMPTILLGNAKYWSRPLSKNWATLEDFKEDIRLQYGIPDLQLRLKNEIRTRTQGPDESISTYLAALRLLMDKCSPRMSLKEQLDMAYLNLHPNHCDNINRNQFKNFAELQRLGQDEEVRRERRRLYRPPPSPDQVLFPQSAYKPARKSKTAAIAEKCEDEIAVISEKRPSQMKNFPAKTNLNKSNVNKNSTNTSSPAKNNNKQQDNKSTQQNKNSSNIQDKKNDKKDVKSKIPCWICNSTSHWTHKCPEKTGLICYRCGLLDVKCPDCPNCNPQSKN